MAKSNNLRQFLTADYILRLAGERYYQRGLDYFRRGKVVELENLGNRVEAIVHGTEEYLVKLAAKSGGLEHRCNCPLGLDEEFCKHCVAVALAWLEEQSANSAGTAGRTDYEIRTAGSARITDEDIADALNAQDKEVLVNQIFAWAESNEPLREKLMQMAARRKSPEAGLAQARKNLERVIRVRRFVDYREMPGYASSVEAALAELEDLLKDGQAAGVANLCEVGMRRLSSVIESVDDSDGYITTLMEQIQDLHLRACIQAEPEPGLLAQKLFHAEMNSHYDEWSGCAPKYANVLGEEGLAAYRALAHAAWAKVPAKAELGADHGSSHYRITAIMETLAQLSGNVEELVAVLERDLTHAHQYLRIAEIYRQAGDREKALAWAEQGMKAAPGYEGAQLRAFVAEEYQLNDRHADALRIIWIEFRERPDLESYKRLEQFARAAEDWEDWRGQALSHVRRTLTNDDRKAPKATALVHNWRYRNRDRSLLVEIFLYEGKVDEAWQEAQAGGCGDRLWLQLAQLREKQHPEDAGAIYLRLGEQAIVRASGNYDAGVVLLEQAAAVARLLGKSEVFETGLELLLKKYKAKRNLLKRVAERREFLYMHPVIS